MLHDDVMFGSRANVSQYENNTENQNVVNHNGVGNEARPECANVSNGTMRDAAESAISNFM